MREIDLACTWWRENFLFRTAAPKLIGCDAEIRSEGKRERERERFILHTHIYEILLKEHFLKKKNMILQGVTTLNGDILHIYQKILLTT